MLDELEQQMIGKMRLKSGRAVKDIVEEEDDTMAPLITKGGPPQYVPWSFMDMVGLAARLPHLSEGAGKWITALEESTGDTRLALGDIKALLMHVAGNYSTEEIFTKAGFVHAL